MEAFLIYLLKSAGVLTLFFGCYYLFLRKETLFTANRWFLVIGLVTSVILPSMNLTTTITLSTEMMAGTNSTIENDAIIGGQSFSSLRNFLILTYFLGVAIFLARFAVQIRSVLNFIQLGKKKVSENLIYVESSMDVQPFSFFKYIIYNPKKHSEKELESILAHELVHATQKHTVDILCVELISVFQWFNPFAWLYKNALKQNLEFLADAKNSSLKKNRKQYQYILLSQSISKQNLSIVNPFFNPLIKKRIVMINQTPSKKHKTLKSLVILPLLALFLVGFNTKNVYQFENADGPTSENTKIELIIDKDTSNDELVKMKSDLAEDKIDFSYTLQRNDKDEITSFSLSVEGPKNSATLNSSNSNSAIKPMYVIVDLNTNEIAIGQGNKTSFQNKSSSLDVYSDRHSKKIKIQEVNGGEEPLYIIDGKESSKSIAEGLNPDKIKSINVFKGEQAIQNYGEKGKNGVVLITLKQNTDPQISVVGYENSPSPLYIIDGEDSTVLDMQQLDSDEIESMNVLKGKHAIMTYGDKGKNGIVEITTKKYLQNSNNLSMHNVDELTLNTEKYKGYLYIIDGKPSSEKALKKMEPLAVESMHVFGGSQKLIDKYGKKAKNGVIEIVTKK
nr:M56 family peptidase [uncultured Allomuricauda sp.]